MKYFSVTELKKKGFKKIGKNVKISKNVNFYKFHGSIGSNCRIDDNCIFIGKISIGNYVHIAAFNLLSASRHNNKITVSSFTGIGPRCYISCSTEDYLADDISNPTIKKKSRKNRNIWIRIYRTSACLKFFKKKNKSLWFLLKRFYNIQ